MLRPNTLVESYIEWTEERIRKGYQAHLLTFMFNPMPGSTDAKTSEMYGVVTRTFQKVLPRVCRRPLKAHWDELPLWIGCTDWPIMKEGRDSLIDISINDGQHGHMLALESPMSRLVKRGISLSDHIMYDAQEIYVQSEPYLHRIHCKAVVETPDRVTDYVLKALKTLRTSVDDILVLPRARSELI